MTHRILFAGFVHETHSFVDAITPLAEFTIERGAELLAHQGKGSALDGFLEVAEAEGWQTLPVSNFVAMASGTVDHAVFELFWSELEAGLIAALGEGIDGIWLNLHGAMVTTASMDPEGELLARIRALPGAAELPLFAAFDLHANFTPLMAEHASGLVGYRENPHIDARDTAVLAAKLLARALNTGVRPSMSVRNAPIMWPPTGTGTADRPMRDLEALARRLEAEHPEIWAINVIGGYSFSDVPYAGVAFSAISTAPALAETALAELEALAISLRELGLPDEWSLDDALADAKQRGGGPYVIVEAADNIGGGAPGDCTAVLRGLLRHGISNAAVVIADAEAVEALADARPGERRKLSVGGKGSRLDPGPVEIEATFISRSDGEFILEDRNSHLAALRGIHISMGPSAVVETEGIKVLLTTLKTPPFDLGQLRSQGIIPEELAVIGVKAAVAHRRAYDKIAKASYTVTTPGPCTSAIRTLPYQNLRSPVFPLS